MSSEKRPIPVRASLVENVQILRFVAALLVLVGRAIHESRDFGFGTPSSVSAFAWGIGVDIFFVISGFVMFHVCVDSFGVPGSFARFVTARFKRIVPLYWIFSSLMILAILVQGDVLNNTDLSPAWVIASYLFVPWPRLDGVMQPVLGLGWTLNYEVLFYTLFAIILTMPRRIGLACLVLVLIAMAALHSLVPSSLWVVVYWTNPIILEFLAGVGLAILYRRGLRIPLWFALPGAVAAVFFAPASIDSEFRWVLWGGPAAVAVGLLALAPSLATWQLGRWASIGGAASYALYLSHPFSINIVAIVLTKLAVPSVSIFLIIGCMSAIAASIVIHFVLERPLVRILSKPVRQET